MLKNSIQTVYIIHEFQIKLYYLFINPPKKINFLKKYIIFFTSKVLWVKVKVEKLTDLQGNLFFVLFFRCVLLCPLFFLAFLLLQKDNEGLQPLFHYKGSRASFLFPLQQPTQPWVDYSTPLLFYGFTLQSIIYHNSHIFTWWGRLWLVSARTQGFCALRSMFHGLFTIYLYTSV